MTYMHVLIWQPSDRVYMKHIVLLACLIPFKTQKLHFRESIQQRNIHLYCLRIRQGF